MHARHQSGFALACVTLSKLKRDFHDGFEISSGQDLEQQLEALGLEMDSLDALAA